MLQYDVRCVRLLVALMVAFFFFQAEDGIRDYKVTGVQTCALPISAGDAAGIPVRRARGRATQSDRGTDARRVGRRGSLDPDERRPADGGPDPPLSLRDGEARRPRR